MGWLGRVGRFGTRLHLYLCLYLCAGRGDHGGEQPADVLPQRHVGHAAQGACYRKLRVQQCKHAARATCNSYVSVSACACAHMHTRQADLNPQHSARIDASISVLVDLTGANERIFKSPIPLVYTRLTGKYIAQLYCSRSRIRVPALPNPPEHIGLQPLAPRVTASTYGLQRASSPSSSSCCPSRCGELSASLGTTGRPSRPSSSSLSSSSASRRSVLSTIVSHSVVLIV